MGNSYKKDLLLKVLQADYLGGFRLRCKFNDGAVKDVDCAPLRAYPFFKGIDTEEDFQRYGVDSTVFWSTGADIAPEWLYEHGVSV